jgi:hypothetical protein
MGAWWRHLRSRSAIPQASFLSMFGNLPLALSGFVRICEHLYAFGALAQLRRSRL